MQFESDGCVRPESRAAYISQMYGNGLQARQLMLTRGRWNRAFEFTQFAQARAGLDHHNNIERGYATLCGQSRDQPLAAFLSDLKQRTACWNSTWCLGWRVWPPLPCRIARARLDADHNPLRDSRCGWPVVE